MAGQLTIPVLRETRFIYGDEIGMKLTAKGSDEPDYLPIWGIERKTMGFGFGAFGAGRLGYMPGVGFGVGPFGLGALGQGALTGLHKTATTRRAGDYSVSVRARDTLGNVGSYATAETVQHRPTPSPPKTLTLDTASNEICWKWDPDNG